MKTLTSRIKIKIPHGLHNGFPPPSIYNALTNQEISQRTLRNIIYCRVPPPRGSKLRWRVEGSQTRRERALAEASNLKLPTNNAEYTPYSILIIIGKLTGVGRDNIHCKNPLD